MKILSIIILFYSVNIFSKSKDLAKVFTQKAEISHINQELSFPAVVKSRIESKLLANSDQIVMKNIVKLGDKVIAGVPLISLRNQDLTIQYNNQNLKSPLSGTVAEIYVREGQYVKKGSPLLLINDPENLYVQIEVPASDFHKIKKGMNAILETPMLNKEKIKLKISAIGASVDSLTGSVTVELELEKPNKNLIPGIIGSSKLILAEKDLFLVSEKSLYYIGEKIFIATLEGSKVKKVEIQTGERIKDKIELLSGLDLGSTYISESPKYLKDGEEVIIESK